MEPDSQAKDRPHSGASATRTGRKCCAIAKLNMGRPYNAWAAFARAIRTLSTTSAPASQRSSAISAPELPKPTTSTRLPGYRRLFRGTRWNGQSSLGNPPSQASAAGRGNRLQPVATTTTAERAECSPASMRQVWLLATHGVDRGVECGLEIERLRRSLSRYSTNWVRDG